MNTPSVTTSMRVLARNLRLHAHAQADRLADLLAERRGHARRRGACGKAARLQHHDAPGAGERLGEQSERNPRRLAGARRRDENGAVRSREFGAKPGKNGVDRQGRCGMARVACQEAAPAASGEDDP